MTETMENTGISLNAEEFSYLDQLVGKLPTNFGIAFVDFFRSVQQRRNDERDRTKSNGQQKEVPVVKMSQPPDPDESLSI